MLSPAFTRAGFTKFTNNPGLLMTVFRRVSNIRVLTMLSIDCISEKGSEPGIAAEQGTERSGVARCTVVRYPG